MGTETKARVTIDGVVRAGVRVHLDSAAVSIGGRPAITVALTEVTKLSSEGGVLAFDSPHGAIRIALPDASAWAAKMKAPPSRAKKLGLTAGARVGLVGVRDPGLEDEISAAGARVVGRGEVDLLFVRVSASKDLAALGKHAERLAEGGALWVLREKGKAAPVSEATVREAAATAGLVDVKVAAFSETLTAEKLVRRRT